MGKYANRKWEGVKFVLNIITGEKIVKYRKLNIAPMDDMKSVTSS